MSQNEMTHFHAEEQFVKADNNALAITDKTQRRIRFGMDSLIVLVIASLFLLKLPTELVDPSNTHVGGKTWAAIGLFFFVAWMRYLMRSKSDSSILDTRMYAKSNPKSQTEFFVDIAKSLPVEEVSRATRYMEFPASFTPRIAQSVSLSENVLKNTLSIRLDFGMQSAQPSGVDAYRSSGRPPTLPREVFYICWVDKSDDLDKLSIAVDGKPTSSSNFQQSTAMTVAILMENLKRIEDPDRLFSANLILEAEWNVLLSAVICTAPIGGIGKLENKVESERFWMHLRHFHDFLLKTYPEHRQPILELANMISRLAHSYLIWCKFPANLDGPRYYRVEVKYSVPEYSDFLLKSSKTRVRYGLSPRRISYRANLASQSNGFHLDFKLSDELYFHHGTINLYRAATINSEDWSRVESYEVSLSDMRSDRPSGAPSVELAGIGTNRLHLRTRDLGRLVHVSTPGAPTERVTPRVTAEFREIPPGNLGLVFALAIYVTLLVWMVGFNFHAVLFAKSQSGDTAFSQAWITILGTVPAIISAWIISKFSTGVPKAASTTVLLMMWGVFNSIVLVSLSALGAVHRGILSAHPIEGFKIISYPWAILMVSTFAQLLVVSTALILGSIAYNQRVFRSKPTSV